LLTPNFYVLVYARSVGNNRVRSREVEVELLGSRGVTASQGAEMQARNFSVVAGARKGSARRNRKVPALGEFARVPLKTLRAQR
jgi:hypothetical protein